MLRVAHLAAVLAMIALAFSAVWPERAAETGAPRCPHGSPWSLTPGDGKPVREPNPWFFVERAWPRMEIPREAWRQAQAQARDMKASRRDAIPEWVQKGPTNIGGRITCIAVDPRNDQIVYGGAAEGGVMRSTDGGQTWRMMFDREASLAIGALALDPADPDVVYAGTGEVNPGGGSMAYGGTGLYRSLDQGESWAVVGLADVGAIGRIVIDPTDPQRIFVAAMGHLWTGGPERGVYRTEDGGASWERVLFVDDTTGCVDLILRPDQPQTVLAAMWQRIRTPERYDYGGSGCAVWRTDDGGDSWSIVGGLPVPGSDGGRIGLALCRNQSTRMYAVYADRIGYFDGLYRSDDAGLSWTRTNDGALSSVFASYGWWFGNVRCHPDLPNTVFVLGLDFYRSTDGGASWAETSDGMHVDHHGMAWGPAPARVIYEGNDGGVYRSINGGTQWTLLPDQPVTQVYRLGLDAQAPERLYLGGQDISTVRTLTGGPDDWATIFGGDGFQPLIHPGSSNRIWVQYQYGNVYYSGDGGDTFSNATGGVSFTDRAGWNAPHVQDPTDPDRRYFGTNRLYRNVGDTSWTPISGDLTGGPHQNQNGQVRGTLTGIAVSPLDAQVIWTGSDDGRVHVSTDGGGAWADRSTGLPERWITSVRGDPFDRETAYVTISGFRWNEPLPHVYRTTDLGITWEAIAGNLPEAPVNDLLAHPADPGRLFVATDVGVFTTTAPPHWAIISDMLPNVVVTHLAFNAGTSELLAGTYGRSVWGLFIDTALDAAAPALTTGLSAYPNPFNPSTKIVFELASPCRVHLRIFDMAGRQVRELLSDEAHGSGRHEVAWRGVDDAGRVVASGTYLYRLEAGHHVETRMMSLVR